MGPFVAGICDVMRVVLGIYSSLVYLAPACRWVYRLLLYISRMYMVRRMWLTCISRDAFGETSNILWITGRRGGRNVMEPHTIFILSFRHMQKLFMEWCECEMDPAKVRVCVCDLSHHYNIEHKSNIRYMNFGKFARIFCCVAYDFKVKHTLESLRSFCETQLCDKI